MTPCVRELRVTYTPSTAVGVPLVWRPADAGRILVSRLDHEPVEVCVVLLLNTKHRLLAVHEVGRGTLDSCIVHPRDVFKAALLANAGSVIVGHNHPSGETDPSAEDVALCERLRNAANLIGIELLDYVIVGDGRYYSFQEHGK